jgi:Zn-dependent peptidase ImmA (M78 family)
VPLRRGFKAESERRAADLWKAMGLKASDAMDAIALGKHLDCIVRSAGELIDVAKLKELKRIQDDAFFACTFELSGNRRAIVYSPLSPERINSDVAHEVAHVLLGHQLSRLEHIDGVAFLSCDTTQEDEAKWLAGCLLLPRVALMHDLKRRMSISTIAKNRVLSEQMIRYRINVTGADRQITAGTASRPAR